MSPFFLLQLMRDRRHQPSKRNILRRESIGRRAAEDWRERDQVAGSRETTHNGAIPGQRSHHDFVFNVGLIDWPDNQEIAMLQSLRGPAVASDLNYLRFWKNQYGGNLHAFLNCGCELLLIDPPHQGQGSGFIGRDTAWGLGVVIVGRSADKRKMFDGWQNFL